jgi:NitT/TauT family transport system permease protein
MKPKYSKLITLSVPVVLLTLWVCISLFTGVKKIILPPPWTVAEKLGSIIISGRLWADLGLTVYRTGLGFLLGVSTGILLGAAMGSLKRVHDAMIFPVDALRSLPATTLFPLFMLCLGWGTKSLVALVAFPCCWLVTINTMYGVKNSSKIRQEMAKMFRLSSSKLFFFVTLPDALPSIAASLRLSVAISLHMAIIGEMFMGTTNGLGYRIFDAHMLLRVPEMYALIIVVGVLGYVLNYLFVRIEGQIFFWGA